MQVEEVVVLNAADPAPTRCEHCAPGTVRTESGADCVICPPGTHESNGVCRPCGPNTYSADPGLAQCLKCGEGTDASPDRTRCVPLPLVVSGDDTYDLGALQEMVREAADKGFGKGGFSFGQKEYHFGIFEPIPMTVTDSAHVWSRDLDSPRSSGTCAVGAADIVDRGDLLDSVRGASTPGVELLFARTEEASTGIPDCIASSVAFLCDDTCCGPERWPRAISLVDGPTELPGRSRYGTCTEVLQLEWRTPLACPLCRPEHFEKVPGACSVYGSQEVQYLRATPCVGATRSPTVQDCEIESPRTAIVGIVVTLLVLITGTTVYFRTKWQKTYRLYAQLKSQYEAENRPNANALMEDDPERTARMTRSLIQEGSDEPAVSPSVVPVVVGGTPET